MAKKNHLPDQYIPGVCNIGPEEIKRRKRRLKLSVIIVAASLFFYFNNPNSFLLRAFLFISLSAFMVMYLQVRKRFCIRFGLTGHFNFGKLHKREEVTDRASKAKDQILVVKMLLSSMLFALIFMLLMALFSKLLL